MEFPTIFDWLAYFDFLRGMPAVYAVLALSLIIFFVPDWRVSLLSLTVYYLVVGLLFADVLEPRLAFIKVIVGLFSCLIFYVTGRQVHWPSAPEVAAGANSRQRRMASFLFRLFWAVVLLLVSFYAGRQFFPVPAAPAHYATAVYFLVGIGLFTAVMTGEPLRAGAGVLLLLGGFELYYNSFAAALSLLLGMAAVNLAVALVTAFLVQTRYGLAPLTR